MNYQLIIKIPFEALDDIEAREKAKNLMANVGYYANYKEAEIKLQAVFPNKPPVKVAI